MSNNTADQKFLNPLNLLESEASVKANVFIAMKLDCFVSMQIICLIT